MTLRGKACRVRLVVLSATLFLLLGDTLYWVSAKRRIGQFSRIYGQRPPEIDILNRLGRPSFRQGNLMIFEFRHLEFGGGMSMLGHLLRYRGLRVSQDAVMFEIGTSGCCVDAMYVGSHGTVMTPDDLMKHWRDWKNWRNH